MAEERIKRQAKSGFHVWQETVEIASKELAEYHNARELDDEIDEVRKQKKWVKVDDVLQILAEQKEKFQQFETWLEEREEKSKTEFRKKGWGDTKLEITVVKEKFIELIQEGKLKELEK